MFSATLPRNSGKASDLRMACSRNPRLKPRCRRLVDYRGPKPAATPIDGLSRAEEDPEKVGTSRKLVPSALKPHSSEARYGTAEAVPLTRPDLFSPLLSLTPSVSTIPRAEARCSSEGRLPGRYPQCFHSFSTVGELPDRRRVGILIWLRGTAGSLVVSIESSGGSQSLKM